MKVYLKQYKQASLGVAAIDYLTPLGKRILDRYQDNVGSSWDFAGMQKFIDTDILFDLSGTYVDLSEEEASLFLIKWS
mgnify:FL=1